MESLRASGNGPCRDTELVSQLSDGARALLVAMITQPIIDTGTFLRGGKQMFNAPSMTVAQIRQAFTTYKSLRTIGHEASDNNIRNWIYELHMNSIIDGGNSAFGSFKAFTGPRGNDDKTKYRLRVPPRAVLKWKGLEITHKAAIEEFLLNEERLKQSSSYF